ncbi:MAG: transglutaminase domain-containing protein [Elainellaceae cyanobacterium]
MTSANLDYRTIRPIGAYALHGLASTPTGLLALDAVRGYLLQIDATNDSTRILNPHHAEAYLDGVGLAVWDDTLWYAKGHTVFCCRIPDLTPEPFVRLPYLANGVAVTESVVYVACQKYGYIQVFARDSAELVTRFPAPGIGIETLAIHDDELWVCDRDEQTVYCMDRATGEIRFSLLTPLTSPSGITFHTDDVGQERCYIAYALEEPYIRDDPNSENPYQLTFRDRTFIHPLNIYRSSDDYATLSNGYLVEMSYVEELLPLDEVTITDLEWRIALPAETKRQRIRSVEPVGMPFTEEVQKGQRVAVFKFPTLKPNERRIFGWRATLELYSIKYQITPSMLGAAADTTPPEALQDYLIDNDDLAMDQPLIQRAAEEAVGTETNALRQMLKIRNYVYDRLSYGIKPHIDTPDVALERGVGSCGEYVGVILALARLNGIPCRTIGRYKCPPHPELQGVPLEPDFNHVWIEFYVPGIGWLPMESNVDDVQERGPYPTRFFMGLSWYHMEIGKGISFEKIKATDKPDDTSIGDLAINHVRFRILDELSPAAPSEQP